MTNSILAVSELSSLSHIDLYVVGGSVSGNLPASLGAKANEEISRFKVDKAFIGVHSISFDAGLTAISDAEMQMKQSIIRTTSKVIVLADSSRFSFFRKFFFKRSYVSFRLLFSLFSFIMC